jgi:hypothetical protein
LRDEAACTRGRDPRNPNAGRGVLEWQRRTSMYGTRFERQLDREMGWGWERGWEAAAGRRSEVCRVPGAKSWVVVGGVRRESVDDF